MNQGKDHFAGAMEDARLEAEDPHGEIAMDRE